VCILDGGKEALNGSGRSFIMLDVKFSVSRSGGWKNVVRVRDDGCVSAKSVDAETVIEEVAIGKQFID
jgi:hypothetical protein